MKKQIIQIQNTVQCIVDNFRGFGAAQKRAAPALQH